MSFYTKSTFNKALNWGKLVTITGISQILIQAISLISGILIIRILPTSEYALYTLANTMLGTLVSLADGGLGTSVMAQCGRVWEDKRRVGTILATGFDLRKKFAIVSLIIGIPILLYFLHTHGSKWLMAVVITLSLIPVFISTLYGHLLEIIPRLGQKIVPIQKIQISANLFRLAALSATIFTFPMAYVAICSTILPQLWANKKFFRLSAAVVNWQQSSDDQVKNKLLDFVRLSLPNAVYFSLSSQILIWLISIFGSTASIAQVGALGRLAMVLMIFTTLFSTLVTPRFAKLNVNKRVILLRYLQILIVVITFAAFVVATVTAFPKPMLWILGKGYSSLSQELGLVIIGSCLNLIVNAVISLYTSRGWALQPAISIGANIGAVIAGSMIFEFATLKGILYFNIFQATLGAVIHFSFGYYKIKRSEDFC